MSIRKLESADRSLRTFVASLCETPNRSSALEHVVSLHSASPRSSGTSCSRSIVRQRILVSYRMFATFVALDRKLENGGVAKSKVRGHVRCRLFTSEASATRFQPTFVIVCQVDCVSTPVLIDDARYRPQVQGLRPANPFWQSSRRLEPTLTCCPSEPSIGSCVIRPDKNESLPEFGEFFATLGCLPLFSAFWQSGLSMEARELVSNRLLFSKATWLDVRQRYSGRNRLSVRPRIRQVHDVTASWAMFRVAPDPHQMCCRRLAAVVDLLAIDHGLTLVHCKSCHRRHVH